MRLPIKEILFVAINLILASWFLDIGHNDGVVSRAAATAALVHEGSWVIDAYEEGLGDKSFLNGHFYSDKAPLPSLLVVPFYWLLDQIGFVENGSSEIADELLRIGGFICGSVPFVLIILLFRSKLKRNRHEGIELETTLLLLALYGSMLFVYAGSFQAHILAAFFIIYGAISIEKGAYLQAGICAGAGFLCEYTLLLVSVIWFFQLFKKAQKLRMVLAFAKGAVPFGLLAAFLNMHLTGEPFTFMYKYAVNFPDMADGYGFGIPELEVLWGLSFSQYRGLFFYSPLLIWFAFRWMRSEKKRKWMQLLTDPYFLPAFVIIIVVSSYAFWWGGWSFGPRHLITPSVLLLYLGFKNSIAVPVRMVWPYLFASAGFLLAIAAKITLWYDLPTGNWKPIVSLIIPALKKGEWTQRSGISQWLTTNTNLSVSIFLIMLFTFIFAYLTKFTLAGKAEH